MPAINTFDQRRIDELVEQLRQDKVDEVRLVRHSGKLRWYPQNWRIDVCEAFTVDNAYPTQETIDQVAAALRKAGFKVKLTGSRPIWRDGDTTKVL